jgi:hypothetical protein
MTRNLKTFAFGMLAFAVALLFSHKLYAGVAAGVVCGIGTYLTWWPNDAKSSAYAVCGGMFGLIAISVTTRGDWLPGILMFLAGIACALRANAVRKREHA